MKKVSAVDWLVSRWEKFQQEGVKMSWDQIIQITKLAKEMEKEHIVDAKNSWFEDDRDGEEYYNEVHGK
jgi:hypothetical protein